MAMNTDPMHSSRRCFCRLSTWQGAQRHPALPSSTRSFASSRSCAVRASTSRAEASTSQGELKGGAIVNYMRNGKSGLALVTDRDGKRNWFATDLRHALSIPCSSLCVCGVLAGPGTAPQVVGPHCGMAMLHSEEGALAASSCLMASVLNGSGLVWGLMLGWHFTSVCLLQWAECIFAASRGVICIVRGQL